MPSRAGGSLELSGINLMCAGFSSHSLLITNRGEGAGVSWTSVDVKTRVRCTGLQVVGKSRGMSTDPLPSWWAPFRNFFLSCLRTSMKDQPSLSGKFLYYFSKEKELGLRLFPQEAPWPFMQLLFPQGPALPTRENRKVNIVKSWKLGCPHCPQASKGLLWIFPQKNQKLFHGNFLYEPDSG